MRHDPIPADTLRQTLDYAEAVLGSRDFHLFHCPSSEHLAQIAA